MLEESANNLEFVNREDELQILRQMAPGPGRGSSLVVIKSATGIGKTRLTDEFTRRDLQGSVQVVKVDPLVRQSGSGTRLYDGFFIQKCAASMDHVATTETSGAIIGFRSFLQRRRWSNARSKSTADAMRTMPSVASAYVHSFDYLERILVFGRYSPKALLSGDGREAIAACHTYVDAMVRLVPMVLVIRQAQHIDHESLRTFLSLNRSTDHNTLIMEYTSEDGSFEPDHEKLILRELNGHPRGCILHLLRLDSRHLETLLGKLNLPSQALEFTSSGHWNGNLRTLEQLKHYVTIKSPLTHSYSRLIEQQIDPLSALHAQLESLTTSERLLLSVVAAHVEAIPKAILFAAAHRIVPHESRMDLQSSTDRLVGYRLLRESGGELALANEDLSAALPEVTGVPSALGLAQASIRDVYVDAFQSRDATIVSRSVALRRALRLSAQTKDPQMVLRLIGNITDEVTKANDQGIYVDTIVETLGSINDLLPSEKSRLTRWAASLSYDIGDFVCTRRLLDTVENPDNTDLAILAHCLIEVADHHSAAVISARFRQTGGRPELELMADLIDAGIALDGGAWSTARQLLDGVIERGTIDRSPIVGQALRLLAEIHEYPASTEAALESVTWFKSCGLKNCQAYSALSACRFLARMGRINEARTMITEAAEALHQTVRDEHIILNNKALIELLSPEPDYTECVRYLQIALRTARDDFADLTILTNLAIAHWKCGAIEDALHCTSRALAVLDDPGFAERDVLWPVCYNVGQILDSVGRHADASAVRRRPHAAGWGVRSNATFWACRYNESSTSDAALAYLDNFDYFPVALSHWQIDREALASLSGEWCR